MKGWFPLKICHTIYVRKIIFTSLVFIGVFFFSLISTYFLTQQYFKRQVDSSAILPSLPPQATFNPKPTAIPELYSKLNSLDQIDLNSKLEDPNLTSIVVTGDVLLARSVNVKMTQINDFTWPFQLTKDKLQQADITFINLETPLIADCPQLTDGMVFCGHEQGVDGLTFAGVDVVNIANNHAGNWEEEGVLNTEEILKKAGIEVTGVNDLAIKNVNGTKFGFLGFNEVNSQPGIPNLTDNLLRNQIKDAKQHADVVIVQFHWGQEYTYRPTTNQTKWAHLAIDYGADVVVGNHPHWWQPMEFYKNKLIVYSHGNFVFDQMWSYETREGLVGEYLFEGKNLVDVKFHPVFIENYGQPRWLEGVEKQKVLDHFLSESKKLAL